MKSLTTITPNIRYATGFLDTKYRERALNDESLMDKKSGELYYKRKYDDKLISFSKDKKEILNILESVKGVGNANIYYRQPTIYDDGYENTYLTSIDLDLDLGTVEEDETLGTTYSIETTIPMRLSNKTTGFFININTNPREASAITYLTKLYDEYITNIETTDELILARKAMFNNEGYADSNIIIEYEYDFKLASSSSISHNTGIGYARLNETSFIPMLKNSITDDVKVITFKINRIYSNKLEYMNKILELEPDPVYSALLDLCDFKFKSCNISYFTSDDDFDTYIFELPVMDVFDHVALFMPMNVVDQWFDNIDNVSGGKDIIVSVKRPSDAQWKKIRIWAEVIRNVNAKSVTEETDSTLKFSDLDVFFGASDVIAGNLTTTLPEDNDHNSFYVLIKGVSAITVS